MESGQYQLSVSVSVAEAGNLKIDFRFNNIAPLSRKLRLSVTVVHGTDQNLADQLFRNWDWDWRWR